ncbi:hypothetical protein Psed_6848 (plasmid) [Pseudonocardia dioxanivorans CB1190]|uniref:Uncharacterized protein n=1 Tax=Pseudonocardia dioxanivorans (strain ATCC 55486 / DSM 44775 / JCM 13855 / CB1190) TaxID=675635 RepID=F2L6M5_PSEUX|nr:hypothetical protein [Pseudonocardia dioxanivorans]AEA28919.1 hypothetical protein Psed_6848 [Pseudonocardia dioxanivorans CB1190]
METMTDTTTVDTAEQLRQVADLIAQGANREARRRTGRIADAADPETRALLGQILAALEKPPAVAVPRLRHLWKVSAAAGRELVEACAPRSERHAEAAKETERAVRATRAERREYARRRPGTVVPRQGVPQPRRSQRATDQDTAARRYFDERSDPAEGGKETPEHVLTVRGPACRGCGAERTTGDQQRANDNGLCSDCRYEWVDSQPPMRGLPCVACGLERSPRDQQRAHDDGLCEDCRDSGTAGVPILPATATRADVLTARCDYIDATSETTKARDARLRRDQRHMPTGDRIMLADWIARQPA